MTIVLMTRKAMCDFSGPQLQHYEALGLMSYGPLKWDGIKGSLSTAVIAEYRSAAHKRFTEWVACELRGATHLCIEELPSSERGLSLMPLWAFAYRHHDVSAGTLAARDVGLKREKRRPALLRAGA